MARKPSPKLQCTKNYRLFTRSVDNRPLNLRKRRDLRSSMKAYGFIPSQAISVMRDKDKSLVVKDGQHRLALAEELGLPVYYVVDEVDWDVAAINNTPKTWSIADYAMKFSANGLKDYTELLEFCETHSVPHALAAAILNGSSSFSGGVSKMFKSGRFKIKDRPYAAMVVETYKGILEGSKEAANRPCLEACMAACRVESFDPDRLRHSAVSRRDEIVRFATRESYLKLFEDLYNFHRSRKNRIPLKFLAESAIEANSRGGVSK